MRITLLLLVAVTYAACASLTPKDDDSEYNEDDVNNIDEDGDMAEYDDGEEDATSQEPPVIKTKPHNITAKSGDDVRLDCDVVNVDAYVLAWKRNDESIILGPVVYDTTRGIINYNNGTIVIPDVRDGDDGDYMCYIMITNNESINVTIHLSLESGPKIHLLEASIDNKQLKAGDDLELTCLATGNPKPTIKWYFDTKHRNANEEPKEAISIGEKLLIENIGVDRSGHYRCLADNGHDAPAHKSIFIEVTGKPSVRMEKVYSDNKLRELVCVVYAHPDATVQWIKDGRVLNNIREDKLIFNKHSKTDAGVYTCVARNPLGENSATIHITGVPEKPHLSMMKCTKHKHCVLEWTVHSNTPILESIISYSEKGQPHAKEVFPAAPHKSKDNLFAVSYTFSDLKQGIYEAKFKSKNEHGWSQFSNNTPFEIKGPRHTKYHSSHVDTRANNGAIDRAESHTDIGDGVQSEEEDLQIGSQTSSAGATGIFATGLLIGLTIALLRP